MKIKVAIMVAAISLVCASKSYAMLNIKPEGTPIDRFDVEMKAGEERSFKFRLTNESNKEEESILYVSPQLTATNGGSRFSEIGEDLEGEVLWTDTEEKAVKLKPSASKVVEYKVQVPDDTKPGQYIIVVAVYNKNIAAVKDTVTVNGQKANITGPANITIGKQIVINIPGEYKRKVSIDSFKYSYYETGSPYIETVLYNKGNVLEKPSTYIEILDSNNTILSNYTLDKNLSFYANTEQKVNFSVNKMLGIGDYKARVLVRYSNKEEEKIFDFTVTKEDIDKALNRLPEAIKGDGNNSTINTSEASSTSKMRTIMNIVIGVSSFVTLSFVLIIILILKRKRKKDTTSDSSLQSKSHGGNYT